MRLWKVQQNIPKWVDSTAESNDTNIDISMDGTSKLDTTPVINAEK